MIIQSKNVWIDESFKSAQIEIKEKKIIRIYPFGTNKPDFDFGESYVMPGLIDIHTHGYKGINANYINEEQVREWVEYLPHEGVTSVLITTSTAPEKDLVSSLSAIVKFKDTQKKGANVLGIHMEGPFLEMAHRGAQSAESIMKPTPEKMKLFMDAAQNQIKLVAIAPETDTDYATTKFCIKNGIVVSVGHSGATMAMVKEVKALGVNNITHTYNAMSPLNHREPGVVGAAMRYEDMYAEIIGDGVHVHNDAINILGRLKGKDKLILVTDSVSIKGMAPGIYKAQDRVVTIDSLGFGHLADGRLAGSSNRMNKLLKNCTGPCELPFATAINAATCNPAKLLGIANVKGYLRTDYDADIVVTNQDFEVIQTFVLGKAQL